MSFSEDNLNMFVNELQHKNIKIFKQTNELVQIRCEFCGDSTNPHHAHMYISKVDDVLLYYCQRCNASGLINNSFFSLYNFSPSISANIVKTYPKYRTSSDIKSDNRLYPFKIVPPAKKKDYYDAKMEYFTKRTGLEPLGINIQKYKIIYSLKNFISKNKDIFDSLDFEINDYFLDTLEKNYIGFLNSNNSAIVMRKVTDIKKMNRFYYIRLVKDKGIISFYSPVANIDKQNVVVNFCEGVFDCINLENIKKDDEKNQLFIAVLNKDYNSKIDYLIRQLGLDIKEFNFFLDRDHDSFKQFKDIISLSNFFKNSYGKDYGDINTKIKFKKVTPI